MGQRENATVVSTVQYMISTS